MKIGPNLFIVKPALRKLISKVWWWASNVNPRLISAQQESAVIAGGMRVDGR